jgi:hypothetical protein
MATKQISLWDGFFYMMYKNAQIADDNDVLHTITDIQVDFIGDRFTVTFDNGDKRNIGFKDIVLMDIDGIALEATHEGSEQQLTPNKRRLKNRKRKP